MEPPGGQVARAGIAEGSVIGAAEPIDGAIGASGAGIARGGWWVTVSCNEAVAAPVGVQYHVTRRSQAAVGVQYHVTRRLQAAVGVQYHVTGRLQAAVGVQYHVTRRLQAA